MNHHYGHELFSVGKRYQFVAWAYLIGFVVPVPFWIMYKFWPKLRTDYLYTPMIWYVDYVFSWLMTNRYIDSYSIGWLGVGIGSSVLSMFTVGFVSRWWLRTRHSHWFAKYNYILAAGLDGGTQVRFIFKIFILY